MAAARGVEVFTAFCESHASHVPFHVVARLLRATTASSGLDDQSRARIECATAFPTPTPRTCCLFHDLLGIADPNAPPPAIDPDARRRRLTALVNAVSLARASPAVFVLEDVHWIDEVSESLLAEFVTVIPQTHSLALVTYRPEYEGALASRARRQTIALAPLSDSETTALLSRAARSDPSVASGQV